MARRRASWVDAESRVAERARDGFTKGFIRGMIGMALAGFTGGRLAWPGQALRPHERIPSVEEYYKGRLSPAAIEAVREDCKASGAALHDALMEKAGWPAIQLDGQLLVSHQDALLMGGKVQAPAGYADHVRFPFPDICAQCREQTCVEVCSAQAITARAGGGTPEFDREKCVHCGACMWSCSKANPGDAEQSALDFRAGAGGLHSAEN